CELNNAPCAVHLSQSTILLATLLISVTVDMKRKSPNRAFFIPKIYSFVLDSIKRLNKNYL
ncbi:hypothetical protein CWC19_19820, partial [Pseudoalteromonas aurantia]